VRTAPPLPEAGHRERLLSGLAAAITECRGFQRTTVAGVVAHARTSRRTFYEHFEDREGCFLALFDDLSERLLGALAAAAGAPGPWGERVERALAAYLAGVAAQPEVTRACLREVPGLGPRGVERARRMDERWARQIAGLVAEAAAGDPALRPIPLDFAVVITGGFRDLVLSALDHGRDLAELQAVGTDLVHRLVQDPASQP
jgi:AcrR family transcriptional regulator